MATGKRCDNCFFSTYATAPGRAALICRQKKGSEGRWVVRPPLDRCPNFYPSTAGRPGSGVPRAIPLTRGLFAIVDAADYERLSRHTWFAEGTTQNCYAVRKDRGRSVKMHREIMHAPDHLVVDHIDHNGLNNRRANLRLCTFAENCRNLRIIRHKTSKYKGVHWHKGCGKWAAQITANNKRHHLGYFTTEIEAARAYDRAAPKYHGEFAHLNLPDSRKRA